MKIDERLATYMSLLQNDTAKTAVTAGEASATATHKNPSADAVDLSTTAVTLADDEAHRARLNLIRQQLAEGSYNISGKDVADKMLNALKG